MSAQLPRKAQPDWQLDELAFVGRENLDAEHVARYDAKEDAGAAAEVELLKAAGMTGEARVVEFGAGTGQFTVAVAPECARVTAVDVSPVMLRALGAKVAERGLGNVDLAQAGFLSYEHEGEAADIAYSRYALHHIPDPWKALALSRIRAVLKPGGIFRLWDVIYDFEPGEAEQRLDAWCATGGDQVEGEWSRAELAEHVREEHSTFTWLLEPMIDRAGFEIAERECSDDGIFAKYLLLAS